MMLRRWPPAALAASIILHSAATASAAEAKVRVDFVDVGQGDAALITSPTGKVVLIDGGPPESAKVLADFVARRVKGPLDLVLNEAAASRQQHRT